MMLLDPDGLRQRRRKKQHELHTFTVANLFFLLLLLTIILLIVIEMVVAAVVTIMPPHFLARTIAVLTDIHFYTIYIININLYTCACMYIALNYTVIYFNLN